MPARLPTVRDLLHGLVAAALLGVAGCADTSLDTLDGVRLGEPQSAVWGLDPNGTAMVVLSDFPDLCDALEAIEPPSQQAWWVVSVWTDAALREETPLAASGFASITQGGQVTEYAARAAEIEVGPMAEDDDDDALDTEDGPETTLDGHVRVEFETGDTLEAEFEADACTASLFRGL